MTKYAILEAIFYLCKNQIIFWYMPPDMDEYNAHGSLPDLPDINAKTP